MNKQEMLDVMTYIFADHDLKISEEKLAVWHDQFKSVPLETAMKAARIVGAENTFGPPKVHNFHEALRKVGGCVDPEEAWSEFLGSVKTFGRYLKPEALCYLRSISPALADVAESMYEELCNSNESEHGTIRRQFWEMFSARQTTLSSQAAGLLPPGDEAVRAARRQALKAGVTPTLPQPRQALPEPRSASDDVNALVAKTAEARKA